MVPHPARAVEDPEERVRVRAHAARALGNPGGAAARLVLESSLSRENGIRVKEEILAALEKI